MDREVWLAFEMLSNLPDHGFIVEARQVLEPSPRAVGEVLGQIRTERSPRVRQGRLHGEEPHVQPLGTPADHDDDGVGLGHPSGRRQTHQMALEAHREPQVAANPEGDRTEAGLLLGGRRGRCRGPQPSQERSWVFPKLPDEVLRLPKRVRGQKPMGELEEAGTGEPMFDGRNLGGKRSGGISELHRPYCTPKSALPFLTTLLCPWYVVPRMTSPPRTAALFGLVAFAYLYPFPYFPGINNPNENVRFYMTAALVEDGTYEISGPRSRWGWTNDAARVGDKFFSVKAPGTSLLGVPGYAAYLGWTQQFGAEWDRTVALWVCRATATVLPMLVFLFAFHRWLDRRVECSLARDSLFLSVAVGSLLYGYGLLFVSHSLGAAGAFAAFMLLSGSKETESPRRAITRAFFAGLLAASATWFEYPGLVLSLVLTGYAAVTLRPWRRLIPYALGGALPTLSMMHFQAAAFGSPFSPGHLYVETDAFREAHEEGLYGANAFHWDAAGQLLFDPGFGLFPLTPLLILAIPGFFLLLRAPRERTAAAFALAAVGLTYLVICFMNNWRGGWTIGPRYLAGIVPFLAWPASVALGELIRSLPRVGSAAAIAGVGVGVVASGLPSAYYPHIPPSFARPLPELFALLLSHDYAPFNAGAWVGLTGTLSMVPLGLAVAVSVALVLYSRPWKEAALVALGASAAGAAAVFALTLGAPDIPPHADLAVVTRQWAPRGNDAAARLDEELARSPSRAGYERLVELYLAEGRDQEARAAQLEADALR